MEELFAAVIVVAVLAGVWAVWGPKAMLGVIAVPTIAWVVAVVYTVVVIVPRHDSGPDVWVPVELTPVERARAQAWLEEERQRERVERQTQAVHDAWVLETAGKIRTIPGVTPNAGR